MIILKIGSFLTLGADSANRASDNKKPASEQHLSARVSQALHATVDRSLHA